MEVPDKNNPSGRKNDSGMLLSEGLNPLQKFIIWTGIILTLCAVGVFIWLIVKSSQAHSAQGVVMASSFIVFAVGMLYFSLMRQNNPRKAWISLYITLPLAVGAFIISLYLDGGERDRQEFRSVVAEEKIYENSGNQ